MIIKKHLADGRRLILAVCDDELLGKKFEEKGRQLDVRKEFYGGEEINLAELVPLIKKSYIINAVGKKAVACCIQAGICTESDILKINGVPYFQAVLF